MECKDDTRNHTRIIDTSIDLTRMECKVYMICKKGKRRYGIDLTRMECKDDLKGICQVFCYGIDLTRMECKVIYCVRM